MTFQTDLDFVKSTKPHAHTEDFLLNTININVSTVPDRSKDMLNISMVSICMILFFDWKTT